MKFDILFEKIYNMLNKNKRSVIYAAPEEDSADVERILNFIENDTLLVTKLNELNSNPNTTHQHMVGFFNTVIQKANKEEKLLDIPRSVWLSLRDYTISRIYGASLYDAMDPAWPKGPSTIEAFDDMMNQRDVEVRKPFHTYFADQFKKGLGKEHIFHRQRAEAEAAAAQDQNKNKNTSPNLSPISA